MAIGEVFLGAIITVLLDLLASGELFKFLKVGGLDDKIKKWMRYLMMINAVLSDAEERQITNKAVHLWLEELQDLAYDMDDILDLLNTKVSCRNHREPESFSTSKVRKLIPSCCTSFTTPSAFKFDREVTHKIDDISKRLDDLMRQKDAFGLTESSEGMSNHMGQGSRATTSVVEESHTFGREEDKAAICKLLLEERTRNHDGEGLEVCVIPIYGMGGLGKTTLAQLIYNDEQVKGHFDHRAWVCVSEDFDLLKISNLIYESVTEASSNFKDLNSVQIGLKDKLFNKTFLVVLDDVWEESYAKWDQFQVPFLVAAPESAIVVTTRSQKVAEIMGSMKSYDLKLLSDSDCISLLAQHSLRKPNFDMHSDLKETGEEIARKCGGLPLAAKSLGGVLRNKTSLKQWQKVATSEIWNQRSDKNDVLPALRLSYHHLRPHLKPAFAYCSIFPKDFLFRKDDLILLWMAEGLLNETEENKQMEELGSEYFDELLSRTFFTHAETRNGKEEPRFLMHDLINDLAISVAGKVCLGLDEKIESNKVHSSFSEKVRHSSFIQQGHGTYRKFKPYLRSPHLRAFLPLRGENFSDLYLSNKVLNELLPNLRCLRVLSLDLYMVKELPRSIGNLKHLRYLNMSYTLITQLPNSICELYNLQTLLLRSCSKLNQLPMNIRDLSNLRHLDISLTPALKWIPAGIGKLSSLCTLSKIVIGERNGFQLMELKGLSHLKGRLSMFGMHNISSETEAREANLSGKEGIHELEMIWAENIGDRLDEDTERRVLDVLMPQAGLERLLLENYGGTSFPSWVGDPAFSNMVHLTLSGCKKCTSLPSLGHLLSLKELFINSMCGVKVVGAEFYGDGGVFPSLETLSFKDMISWDEWSTNIIRGKEIEKAVFPQLGELRMVGCGKLVKVFLPRFPSLGVLTIKGCSEGLVRSMVDLASVKTLEIEEIAGLTKLDEGIISSFGTLEFLEVTNCLELRYLWEGKVACPMLTKLRELDVWNCRELVLLGVKEQVLPPNLERLSLFSCDNLEKIPSTCESLKKLAIYNCNKLKCFTSRKQLVDSKTEKNAPAIATTECRGNCDEMQEEEEEEEEGFPILEILEVAGCASIKWLPTGKKKLPSTLKHLQIDECGNLEEGEEEENWLLNSSKISSSLETIFISGWGKFKQLGEGYLFGFVHLTYLQICKCEGIETIPKRCLPPALRVLVIWGWKNLKSLNLYKEDVECLERLGIMNCKNVELYPPLGSGGWPRNLTSLTMGEVKEPITEWGVHLNSLPTSVTHLTLEGKFEEMACLSDVGIRRLPCLKHLWINGAVNLKFLSDDSLQNLNSLRDLWIWNCPKVGSLPEMILSTLSELHINNCPLLKERCMSKEKGNYWPLFSDLPNVRIDGTTV